MFIYILLCSYRFVCHFGDEAVGLREHAVPAEVVHGAVLDVDVVGVGRRRADVDLNPVDTAVVRVEDGADACACDSDPRRVISGPKVFHRDLQ